MINIRSSFIAWVITGLAGGILKIMHFDAVFNIVCIANFVSFAFLIYFLVKEIRIIVKKTKTIKA